MAKIKVDSGLYGRLKEAVQIAGYSSIEEFVSHLIEKELAKFENADADEKVVDRLRGLGYIE